MKLNSLDVTSDELVVPTFRHEETYRTPPSQTVMHFSDDILIAYLLGDAPAEITSKLEEQLKSDSDLLDRLSYFRQILGHVDSHHGVYEAPADLVGNTLERIDESHCESDLADPEEIAAESSFLKTPATSYSEPSSDPRQVRVAERLGSWSFVRFDSMALALSLILLCSVVLPSIVTARFVARKNQCAHHLTQTGKALISYANSDPQQRFPAIHAAPTPRMAFAGVYSVHLKSSGLPVFAAQLQCPSMEGIRPTVPTTFQNVPTFPELSQLTDSQLSTLQQYVGGDFAYNLGIIENGVVVAPKFEGRSYFAILSDAPKFVADTEELVAHDGRGLNILYEDGSVEFIPVRYILENGSKRDHPFRNLQGVHQPGLTHSDASLAPSYYRPLGELN